jgi:hypothetical protein
LLPPPPLPLESAAESLQSSSSPDKEKELECTVCGEGLGKKGQSKKRRAHPRLKLPVCIDCLAIYESGEFIVDGGHEIYCRWCGDGGGVEDLNVLGFHIFQGIHHKELQAGEIGVQGVAPNIWMLNRVGRLIVFSQFSR